MATNLSKVDFETEVIIINLICIAPECQRLQIEALEDRER